MAELNAVQIRKLHSLYEDETIPLVKVCQRFELSNYMLTKLVKQQGWKKRPVKASKKKSLIKRMQTIASQHISALEKSLQAQGDQNTSGDRDRDARTLRTLLKIVEDLNNLTDNSTTSLNRDEEVAFNAQQRIDLAKRLEALRGSNSQDSK